MNVREYISSGILEAYALGELSEQERAEVEKNLIAYPELKAELDAIEEAQETFLLRTAVQPPKHLKNAVLGSVRGERKTDNIVPIHSNTSIWKYAVAASLALAVVSSYLAINYYSKWQDTKSDLATLIAQNQQVAQGYNQVNQRLQRMENDLKVMENPNFQRVTMTGTPNAPDAMASVYWNQSTQEVYLSIQNMKALSQEKQYQLWAIIDGKPVDAGVFDGNIAGLHKMKEIAKGPILFAVTIEPRGGKSSPTMETMQVKGEVGKS